MFLAVLAIDSAMNRLRVKQIVCNPWEVRKERMRAAWTVIDLSGSIIGSQKRKDFSP